MALKWEFKLFICFLVVSLLLTNFSLLVLLRSYLKSISKTQKTGKWSDKSLNIMPEFKLQLLLVKMLSINDTVLKVIRVGQWTVGDRLLQYKMSINEEAFGLLSTCNKSILKSPQNISLDLALQSYIIRSICKFCKLSVTNCICNTTNIIYKLTCICGDEYVGETSKEVQIRAKQHLKALINKKPELSSFAEHYISKHNLLSNSLVNDTSPFTLSILYKCNSY